VVLSKATRAMLGAPVSKVEPSAMEVDHVGVKAALFSFSRLKGADAVAGVDMVSTGEVGCLGPDLNDAFLKAMLSVGFRIPKSSILLSTGPTECKADFLDSARRLEAMGYKLYASKGTANFLETNGVKATALHWPLEKREPNIADWIKRREFDLVINVPKNNQPAELENDFLIRRLAVDFEAPLITDIKVAKQFTDALEYHRKHGLEIRSWQEVLHPAVPSHADHQNMIKK
jgi:carbamoyl-phosphate synthase large subunit